MIKRECVDEEGWVSEETFKKTLAVYQVLPGPEAHELCVYFGRHPRRQARRLPRRARLHAARLRADARRSRSLYVEADSRRHLDELFYGLTAAVGALVARALVRLGGSFITDVPLALIAVAGFALTVLRVGELRPRAARRRARLRAVDERGPLDAAARTRSRSAPVALVVVAGRRHGLAHRARSSSRA